MAADPSCADMGFDEDLHAIVDYVGQKKENATARSGYSGRRATTETTSRPWRNGEPSMHRQQTEPPSPQQISSIAIGLPYGRTQQSPKTVTQEAGWGMPQTRVSSNPSRLHDLEQVDRVLRRYRRRHEIVDQQERDGLVGVHLLEVAAVLSDAGPVQIVADVGRARVAHGSACGTPRCREPERRSSCRSRFSR